MGHLLSNVFPGGGGGGSFVVVKFILSMPPPSRFAVLRCREIFHADDFGNCSL